MPQSYRRWPMLWMAAAILVPYFMWEAHFPPVFDASVKGRRIDYEFKSRRYAFGFAVLNGAEMS